MRFLFYVSLLLFLISCGREKKQTSNSGTALGQVSPRLEEASGLTASITNPGLLWTVNDSGNPPEVFLIDEHARIKLICRLAGIANRDWEDIAMGAGPRPGKNYVYVGDIGDNQARYEYKYIYRFEEPVFTGDSAVTVTQFDTLILKIPDGMRDTETLLIDPVTHDLYVISKREQSVGLYSANFPFSKDPITLHKVENLPFTQIVGGSISGDGSQVLIKNYDKVYYWKRSTSESMPDLFLKKPIELPYDREPQGEAIAWATDGTRYYTLSEGSKDVRSNLFVYEKKK